jgi:hypothetical protein
MSRVAVAFEKLRGYQWVRIPYLDAAERYVNTGDHAALAQVKPFGQQGSFWGRTLAEGIGHPPNWNDSDRRALHVLGAAHLFDAVGDWFNDALATEKADEDFHALLRSELAVVQVPPDSVLALTARRVPTLARSGRPTSAGRFLLALTNDELSQAISATAHHASSLRLLEFMLDHAADRVPLFAMHFLKSQEGWLRPQACAQLLNKGSRFEDTVQQAFETEPAVHTKFWISTHLFALAPDKYRSQTLQAARASLAGTSMSNNHHQVGPWLVEHFGREVLDDMVTYLSKGPNEFAKRPILAATVQALGRESLPAVLAALSHGKSETKLAALPYLIALDDGTHRHLIQDEVTAGFTHEEANTIVRYVAVATRWDVAVLADALWPLLDHKSKPVRESAARALGRMGEAVIDRAAELLNARRGQARLAAVTVLATANVPAALARLEARLDTEEDEDVRDAILLALQAAWRAEGRTLSSADIDARITRIAAKLGCPVAKWLDDSRLPPLRMSDGRPLTQEQTRYILFRQSRAKNIVADVEVAPFLALIDRTTSGAFALDLLKGFLGSGADAGDRWVLTLTGLLGDDRVVPIISRQIRDWADNSRGKLAEYAVQALALLGSDEALLAVDSMAIRYRTKNKNIGKAAVDAFASAAEAQGLTPDELGDRVVPWLGFEPDQPRVLTLGAKRVEAGIGLDLKLRFQDADSKKRIASLPKTAPKEILAEFKDLSASLKEIAKAQLLRIENLMVRQRRWPAERWRKMFLRHPLLLPFAIQLVWGVYDSQGKRTACFRSLEDRTLTDSSDTTFELPPTSLVGIVHPLELTPPERQEWQVHLADNEVTSPFPQLERPVVLVAPEEMSHRSYTALRGTALNGMTFKGRAERLGWQRGSVCDGGGIISYWKSFPASGCDAFLGVDGMYIGMDMYTSVKLQDLFFVAGGSVEVGSYTYNDPENEDDARVVAFGKVPPIVFSEIMGDLTKIAAQAKAESD